MTWTRSVPEKRGPYKKRPVAERFWSKVHKQEGSEGCWEWLGLLNEKGYGRFRTDRQWVRAHNFLQQAPEGMEPDHLCHTRDLACPGGGSCRHRRCVRPSHIEYVTHSANLRRRHIRKAP